MNIVDSCKSTVKNYLREREDRKFAKREENYRNGIAYRNELRREGSVLPDEKLYQDAFSKNESEREQKSLSRKIMKHL